MNNHLFYFTCFCGFVFALSTIVFGGDASVFYSLPFVILGWVIVSLFLIAGIAFIMKRKYVTSMTLIFSSLLLIFYFFHEKSFQWDEAPKEKFMDGYNAFLAGEVVTLLDHSITSSSKLKNIEKATFQIGKQTYRAELNRPIMLNQGIKLFVTGHGKSFLMTRSKFLTHLFLLALIINVLLVIHAVSKAK